MKRINHSLRLLLIIFFIVTYLVLHAPRVQAEDPPNTITFDNQSGEPALVILKGPTEKTVEVPDGQRRTVNAAAGNCHILVRYGNKREDYRYAKGDPFTVTQTATQYSAITITLHKVIGGDYATHPISSEEFDKTLDAM